MRTIRPAKTHSQKSKVTHEGKFWIPHQLHCWRWRFSSTKHNRRWELGALLDFQNENGLHDVKNYRRTNTIEVQRTSIHWKDHIQCFWDQYGLLSLKFHPQKMTVTLASYFDTLVKLQMVFKKKNCELSGRGVLLHHNNTSHTTSLRFSQNLHGIFLEFFLKFLKLSGFRNCTKYSQIWHGFPVCKILF